MDITENNKFLFQTLLDFELLDYLGNFIAQGVTKDNFFHLGEEQILNLIKDPRDRLTFVLKREALYKKNSSIVVQNSINDTYDDDFLLNIESDILNKSQYVDDEDSTTAFMEKSNDNSNMSIDSVETDFATVQSTSHLKATLVPLEDAENKISNTQNVAGKALRDLLSKSPIGRKLLSIKVLTETEQGKLCDEIIRELLKTKKKIGKKDFIFWSNEIVSVYPEEEGTVYYRPATKEIKNPAGKLQNKYVNLKKWLKDDHKTTEVSTETVQLDEQQSTLLEILKHATPETPNLRNLWLESFLIRDRKSSILEYYEEFPVLKATLGIELLELDFNKSNKADPEVLFKEWPVIAPKILELAETKKLCVELRNSASNSLGNETLSLFVLPFLFKPVIVQSNWKKGQQIWKASKQEIAEGFIYHVPSIFNLEPGWTNRKEKLRKFGLTQQPQVLVAGHFDSFTAYVIINDVKYECSSLLQAVDKCFKAFYALNASYPGDALPVWQFLQRIYKIEFEKNEKLLTDVSVMWKNLRA